MDEIKRLTPIQRIHYNRLIRRLCANNYDGGNCPAVGQQRELCMQIIFHSLLCKYFRRAVLPTNKASMSSVAQSQIGNRWLMRGCGLR